MAYPLPMMNPACRCKGSPTGACTHGHLLQCHAPYSCAEAGCLHMVGNGYSFDSFHAAQEQARERIQAGKMWPYRLDDQGQVYVDRSWFLSGPDTPGAVAEAGPSPVQAER
jgi:hypothetical protein